MEWLIIAVLVPFAIAVVVWGVVHGGKDDGSEAGADEGGELDFASSRAYFHTRRTGSNRKGRE